MLPKNFYDNVEIPGHLKHILYGDSVTEQSLITVEIDGKVFDYLFFNEVWDMLVNLDFEIIFKEDKEYLFLDIDRIKFLTYDISNDNVYFEVPQYIMRHSIKKEVIYLCSEFEDICVTKDHSMIEYDNKEFKKMKPEEIKYLPTITMMGNLYYGKDENITKYRKDAQLLNVRPELIKSTERFDYEGYIYDICIPKTQLFIANNIVVHNTDSIFILIPNKEAITSTTEEKMEVAGKVADDINEIIANYLNEYFLPRSNISINQNSTYFKSELLMDSLMLLDVKKNYALKVLAKKGRVFKTPKIEYVGIAVIKSNVSPLTQDLLKTLIDDIILNPLIIDKERLKKASELATFFNDKFKKCCSELDLNYIAFPSKWGKSTMPINGMILYNFIMEKEVFAQGSAGHFVYCSFKNPKLFIKTGIDITKINGICFPAKYEIEDLKKRFDTYGITIDKEKQWDSLYITTIQRVIELLKKESKGV